MVPKCDRVSERTQDAQLANASQIAGAVVSGGPCPQPFVYRGPPGYILEPREAKRFQALEALSGSQALPCAQGSGASPDEEIPAKMSNAFPYDVLVAEDHPINLKLVRVLLQAAGCCFKCARNGVQALTELEKADFDLIVMDSQMPVMTGIEAIEIIRQRADWKRLIPILSLTAHAMKGAEEYHTAAGADLYMSKPLRSDCFIEAVKSLAQRGRALRARNASGGAGTLPAC